MMVDSLYNMARAGLTVEKGYTEAELPENNSCLYKTNLSSALKCSVLPVFFSQGKKGPKI